MKYTIWTDGACSGNPGPGGYSFIIVSHNENDIQYTFSEGYQMTTNNRMEMMSIIKSLEYLKDISIPLEYKDCEIQSITIKSDSQYAINTFSSWIWSWENSGFSGKKNVDLLKRAIKVLHYFGKKVKFEWVRGHVGNSMNEACDLLAKNAIKKNFQDLLVDENYINL